MQAAPILADFADRAKTCSIHKGGIPESAGRSLLLPDFLSTTERLDLSWMHPL